MSLEQRVKAQLGELLFVNLGQAAEIERLTEANKNQADKIEKLESANEAAKS